MPDSSDAVRSAFSYDAPGRCASRKYPASDVSGDRSARVRPDFSTSAIVYGGGRGHHRFEVPRSGVYTVASWIAVQALTKREHRPGSLPSRSGFPSMTAIRFPSATNVP